jgi:ergothioneine biosynthesis protein EgtB
MSQAMSRDAGVSALQAPTDAHRSARRRELDARPVASLFERVREVSETLAAPLSDADATAQSMPDASPAKWHLAHTTWFFEAMVLVPHVGGYRPFHADFGRLFNSYYESLGARHPRPLRGMLTRPSLAEVMRYRQHVDAALVRALEVGLDGDVLALIELGCHHEQQHQELLLTDILHLLSLNPLRPAYHRRPLAPEGLVSVAPWRYHAVDGGLFELGHRGTDFAFDCEGPAYPAIVEPFRLASRPVSNGDWIAFVEDGAYRQPLLWLSEGWSHVQQSGWAMPLYWEDWDGEYASMTLAGMLPVDPEAPVAHLSHFEADAFARWAGARLPSELEWEVTARDRSPAGNFADSRWLEPRRSAQLGLGQLFGDVWEWTRSSFSPYPRFCASAGAVGEYNGKFMSGQMVLRGGSCVTPAGHVRATYRNFFPPQTRWQFAGLRLAKDD